MKTTAKGSSQEAKILENVLGTFWLALELAFFAPASLFSGSRLPKDRPVPHSNDTENGVKMACKD